MLTKCVMDFVNYVDLGMMVALFFIAMRKRLRKTYPFFCAAIGLQLLLDLLYPIFIITSAAHPTPFATGHYAYFYYFYAYWPVYITLSIVMFATMREIFTHLITPMVQMTRFAKLAFRWTAFAGSLIALTLAPQVSLNSPWLLRAAQQLMRTVSILQLCMLAFIILCTQAIGLSMRSRIFGFSLGFGMLATADFLYGLFGFNGQTMNTWLGVVYNCVQIGATVVWINYALHPEPARKPLVIPINSALLRWNNIATALGHPAGHVALEPAHSVSFMSNVESIVDRVMARNPAGTPPTA